MMVSIIPGISAVYGIYESEEHIYDYRQENKCKISVWKWPFLCRGLLCGYSKEAIVKIAAYRSGIKEDYYADTIGSNKKVIV